MLLCSLVSATAKCLKLSRNVPSGSGECGGARHSEEENEKVKANGKRIPLAVGSDHSAQRRLNLLCASGWGDLRRQSSKVALHAIVFGAFMFLLAH
jgi:hypothetical protein